MNLAQAPGSLAISGYTNLFNGATLTVYSGTIPTTPETAATGTSLYTFLFGTPGFSTPAVSGGFDTLTATIASGAYVASGTAGYARATMAASVARANTTAYVRGALVTAGSNLYVCIAPGTTSGTSTLTTTGYGIVDGSAAFDYVGASTITALADYTVGVGTGDVQFSTLSVQSGVTISITSFKIQVATV